MSGFKNHSNFFSMETVFRKPSSHLDRREKMRRLQVRLLVGSLQAALLAPVHFSQFFLSTQYLLSKHLIFVTA